jgi:hypothetical protein
MAPEEGQIAGGVGTTKIIRSGGIPGTSVPWIRRLKLGGTIFTVRAVCHLLKMINGAEKPSVSAIRCQIYALIPNKESRIRKVQLTCQIKQ